MRTHVEASHSLAARCVRGKKIGASCRNFHRGSIWGSSGSSPGHGRSVVSDLCEALGATDRLGILHIGVLANTGADGTYFPPHLSPRLSPLPGDHRADLLTVDSCDTQIVPKPPHLGVIISVSMPASQAAVIKACIRIPVEKPILPRCCLALLHGHFRNAEKPAFGGRGGPGVREGELVQSHVSRPHSSLILALSVHLCAISHVDLGSGYALLSPGSARKLSGVLRWLWARSRVVAMRTMLLQRRPL